MRTIGSDGMDPLLDLLLYHNKGDGKIMNLIVRMVVLVDKEQCEW